jgi:hypothetical protein
MVIGHKAYYLPSLMSKAVEFSHEMAISLFSVVSWDGDRPQTYYLPSLMNIAVKFSHEMSISLFSVVNWDGDRPQNLLSALDDEHSSRIQP